MSDKKIDEMIKALERNTEAQHSLANSVNDLLVVIETSLEAEEVAEAMQHPHSLNS